MRVSVVMAVYMGQQYLAQQLDSVLPQLAPEDELIVSLDPSTDDSGTILQRYAAKDVRITVLEGPGKGVIANFAHALSHAHGEILCLCDQDDVWLPGKLDCMRRHFAQDATVTVVLHDAIVTDASLKPIHPSFFALRHVRSGVWHNLIRNSYIGCCMAFSSRLLPLLLPFPEKLPMHDQFIGMVGAQNGRVILEETSYLYYRRHGENASSLSHAGVRQMLLWRIWMLRALQTAKRRRKHES